MNMDLYEKLAEKAKKIEEEQKIAEERLQKRRIREKQLRDKKKIEEEFKSSETTLKALVAYKFFIEDFYPSFIDYVISSGDKDLFKDNSFKGSIYFHHIGEEKSYEKDELRGIDGLIVYNKTSDSDGIALYISDEISEELFDWIYAFIERNSLELVNGQYGDYVNVRIPIKQLVDSYYAEVQSVPILEEQIKKIADDYNIEIPGKEEGKKL